MNLIHPAREEEMYNGHLARFSSCGGKKSSRQDFADHFPVINIQPLAAGNLKPVRIQPQLMQNGRMEGLQNLGHLATPISAIIAGVIFVIACFAKAASKSE